MARHQRERRGGRIGPPVGGHGGGEHGGGGLRRPPGAGEAGASAPRGSAASRSAARREPSAPPARPGPDRRARGRQGEDLAAAFLEERGLEILDRNHAIRQGEVDLVARDGEVLCFVEVRSRTSDAQGGPEETVGPSKARRVVAAATDWAARNGALDREIRFDVVAVTLREGEPPRLEHFRAAFDADGRPGLW